jgi:pyruvate/2-oxoglutarate dehydrogenase complex dihydrolipoamide dehydrogenase (E3) component
VSVDFRAVVARKDAIVARWRASVDKRLASNPDKLTLVRGHARFVGEREVDIAGTRYRAETIVINTGGRTVVPKIPGLDGVAWLDNDKVMSLPVLPSHLIVLGGGYIGCELGQMFRRFGSRVTVVEGMSHLVGREDDDVCEVVEKFFRDEGIELVLGTKAERIESAGSEIVVTAGGKQIRGSHLLVSVGRRPNTDDLGCDAGGIQLDPKGYIRADSHYKTSAPGVYAVGDVIDQPQFTHVAWDDHRILYDILVKGSTRGRGGRIIPSTVFTDPQVGNVGLNEKEAKAKGVRYEVATMPFASIARATEIDETAGILKVLVDPETERLVGATIVGAEAGELIHTFLALMVANASVRSFVDAEMVHPAFAEGLQSVLMKLDRFALK